MPFRCGIFCELLITILLPPLGVCLRHGCCSVSRVLHLFDISGIHTWDNLVSVYNLQVPHEFFKLTERMELKGVNIKVLGKGSYGVVHFVKTKIPSSQFYAVQSADEAMSSTLRRKRKSFNSLLIPPILSIAFDEENTKVWRYGFRGTEPYMSTESNIENITDALDVCSLRCIILQMINGRLPWAYRNLMDLRDKFLWGESANIPENMSSMGIQTKGGQLVCYCATLNFSQSTPHFPLQEIYHNATHPFKFSRERIIPLSKKGMSYSQQKKAELWLR
ncbi:hypothetical protein QQP08_009075 [Theobroma cacao]|nr:hypothetical protein QQP08_009075 [Theobroma cacao]